MGNDLQNANGVYVGADLNAQNAWIALDRKSVV
jgi:hypothetical protein